MQILNYLLERIGMLLRLAAVLVGILTAALVTGCVAPVPKSELTLAAKAKEPMTIQMSPLGVAQPAWNGDLTPIPSNYGHNAGYDRHYLFGAGTIAGPASTTIAAVCFWEDGDSKRYCWPNDRPAWIQLKISGKIRRVYYLERANSTNAVDASPPLRNVMRKPPEWWYGGHSCPYCFWGFDGNCYCWDPCP
jgi:hypothetical protein